MTFFKYFVVLSQAITYNTVPILTKTWCLFKNAIAQSVEVIFANTSYVSALICAM